YANGEIASFHVWLRYVLRRVRSQVIESHAICDAPAAIMARYTESRKAQALHHLDHVPRHCSLRVRRVIWRRRRLAACPVAAEVCADYCEGVPKRRRDSVPHRVRFRKSMQ